MITRIKTPRVITVIRVGKLILVISQWQMVSSVRMRNVGLEFKSSGVRFLITPDGEMLLTLIDNTCVECVKVNTCHGVTIRSDDENICHPCLEIESPMTVIEGKKLFKHLNSLLVES